MLECVEDSVEKLPGSGDDGLARAAFGFETIIEVAQVGTVFHSDKRTLYQRATGNFAAILGDTTDTPAISTRSRSIADSFLARVASMTRKQYHNPFPFYPAIYNSCYVHYQGFE